MPLRNREFWSGMLFAGFGIAVLLIAKNYKLGTPGQMEPGFFPVLLGGALTIIGAINVVRGWMSGQATIEAGEARPFMVLAGVVAFALLVRPLGLLLAVAATIAITALASRESRPVEAAALSLVLMLAAAVIFVWGLGLPFSLMPGWW